MNRLYATTLGTLVLTASAVAIGISVGRATTKGTSIAEFELNKEKWTTQRPLEYAVEVEMRCVECFPWHVQSQVSSGSIQSTQHLAQPADSNVYSEERLFFPRDIDETNLLIETAYSRKAHKIEITFDPDYGYPRSTHIDWVSDTAVDDDVTIVLSNFHVTHDG